MSYWVLKIDSIQDAAFLSALPPNGPKSYKFQDGVSLINAFPPVGEAQMCFDDAYPDSTKLYDFVDNLSSVFIVSHKVKRIIEELDIESVEFLQLTLFDHKMNPANKEYYIMNLVGGIDCIDMDKSEYKMNRLVKGRIKFLDKLVLDESKIPTEAKIFRLSAKPNEYIIHDDVRKTFEQNGITNFKLFIAKNWDGLGI